MSTSTTYFWFLFEIVIFTLLLSSILVPKFAAQIISEECSAMFPGTNTPVKRIWYNVYGGFCSKPEGQKGGNCILWNDHEEWRAISDKFQCDIEGEVHYSFGSLGILVPISAGLAFTAAAITYIGLA